MSCANFQELLAGQGAATATDFTPANIDFPYDSDDELRLDIYNYEDQQWVNVPLATGATIDVGGAGDVFYAWETYQTNGQTGVRTILATAGTTPALPAGGTASHPLAPANNNYPVQGGTGVNVRLYRQTSIEAGEMPAYFYPGASIRAQDLNDNFEALRKVVEESSCATNNINDGIPQLDARYWNVIDNDDGGNTQYSTSTSAWPGDNDHVASTAETDVQYGTLVQEGQPATDVTGKTWFRDSDNILHIWNGTSWQAVAGSRAGDTIYDNVFFVSPDGVDTNNGHSVTRAMRTIRQAVLAANGDDPNGDGQAAVTNALIFVFPGVYAEITPIRMVSANMSIVGQAIRSCFVHPNVEGVAGYDATTPAAPELNIMFEMGDGSYISGFTFAGMKASGNTNNFVERNANGQITAAADRSQALDPGDGNGGLGLPRNQGWVAGFRAGASYRKSPYIQNCTVFSDNAIDNRISEFDASDLDGGEARDDDSSCTGGGILCDGSVPAGNSPLRSFVVDSFTQINLDGPGILCTNNGYAQLVSFFGTFCHYHAKARNGGQLNLSNCTTDFGRFGLIAEGRSATPLITGQVNASGLTGYTFSASPDTWTAGSTAIPVDTLVAQDGWSTADPTEDWTTNVPGDTYLMEIENGGTDDVYQIESVTSITNLNTPTATCTVNIVSPSPGGAADNLGLYRNTGDNTVVRFYRQSYISSGGHTMEFVGAGCDYRAIPELGGQAVQANQVEEAGGVQPAATAGPNTDLAHWANKNGGRVYYSGTDEQGRFQVGGDADNIVFIADQKTGALIIDRTAVQVNSQLSTDTNPQLGGNLQLEGWGLGNAITGTNPANVTGDRANDVRIYADANSDVSLLLQNGNPLTTAFRVPVGNNNQRPGAAAGQQLVQRQQGHIRYNTDENTFEGFDGTDWGPLGGLAPGDIGTGPNQVPTNQQLGQMAFVDNVATLRPFVVTINGTLAHNTNGVPQPVFVGEGILFYNLGDTPGLYFNYRQNATTVVLTKFAAPV